MGGNRSVRKHRNVQVADFKRHNMEFIARGYMQTLSYLCTFPVPDCSTQTALGICAQLPMGLASALPRISAVLRAMTCPNTPLPLAHYLPQPCSRLLGRQPYCSLLQFLHGWSPLLDGSRASKDLFCHSGHFTWSKGARLGVRIAPQIVNHKPPGYQEEKTLTIPPSLSPPSLHFEPHTSRL